jgi:tripeptide aminopeptidase
MMINRERLLAEFLELVQIDSETGHEEKIAPVLKQKFAELGLEVYEDNSQPRTHYGSGNLICTLQGNTEGPDIYFTSHMDTVTPGKGVKPIVKEDGYVYSDGTTILGSDDKAGIAALLEGIRVLKENQIPHGKIQFVITIGEESGLVGSRALEHEKVTAEFGFCFDSNGQVGKAVIAAPYQMKIFAKIHGKTAHAGVNPEAGISAITVASHAVSKMKLGRIDPETTANIGKFAGGRDTATNIVVDFVEIEAEARSLVEEKVLAQTEHMKKCFEEAAAQFGASVEFNSYLQYTGYKYSEEDKIVQIAKKAIEAIGREPIFFASGGGSDANVISGYGIPTLNMAVGYERIHTTEERIAISELEKAAELFVSLVRTVYR